MPDDARLLSAGRRPLTIGLVLIVTGIAFESLAVAAVMPRIAEDLDGIRLYGWAFSAFMLAQVVGISIAGPAGDRRGPARPTSVGLVLFGGGLLLGGAAGSMPVLVLARAVQGAGAGAVFSMAYVAMGRAYPGPARARLMAVLSTAWVIPGITGPGLAGAIADAFGWRWVLLGLVPLLPIAGVLTMPSLLRIGPDPDAPPARAGRLRLVVRLAGGVALLLTGLSGGWPPAALAAVVAGAVLAGPALRGLLPAGTLRAAGPVPAAIALRGLTAFAFFGAEAFIPLALTSLKGLGTAAAGLSLTVAALTWASGAWAQAHWGATWGARRTGATGLGLVTAGILGAALLLLPGIPAAVGIAAWGLAGAGMGLSYPATGLTVLEEAPAGQVGTATSALQLADTLGVALGTGLGGAALALALSAGAGRRVGIAAADVIALLAAAAAIAATRGLPTAAPGPAPAADPDDTATFPADQPAPR